MHWTMDLACSPLCLSLSLTLSLCLSFAIAFMMCGCLVNPVPIMRMWVLRIPNGHFPFRPLCPQASSLHIHTHTHHSHTHTHIDSCTVRPKDSSVDKILITGLFWGNVYSFALLSVLLGIALSPFALLSLLSLPPCRLPFVVVCMLDKNQTDPVLTYVTAASWCRSPRALFPLPPALCSVCSAFIKNSFVFLLLIWKPKYCALETKLWFMR